jgi:hypothetical protein
MTLQVNIRKKFDSFLSIFARISMIDIFAITEHTQNNFFVNYPLKMF